MSTTTVGRCHISCWAEFFPSLLLSEGISELKFASVSDNVSKLINSARSAKCSLLEVYDRAGHKIGSMLPRILAIDDEKMIRETLRLVLENKGYEVEVAENGADGIDLQRKNPFDVVITDILMLIKEGIGTIIDLKIAFSELTIIAISGGSRTDKVDYLESAARLGGNRVLAKPF